MLWYWKGESWVMIWEKATQSWTTLSWEKLVGGSQRRRRWPDDFNSTSFINTNYKLHSTSLSWGQLVGEEEEEVANIIIVLDPAHNSTQFTNINYTLHIVLGRKLSQISIPEKEYKFLRFWMSNIDIAVYRRWRILTPASHQVSNWGVVRPIPWGN